MSKRKSGKTEESMESSGQDLEGLMEMAGECQYLEPKLHDPESK